MGCWLPLVLAVAVLIAVRICRQRPSFAVCAAFRTKHGGAGSGHGSYYPATIGISVGAHRYACPMTMWEHASWLRVTNHILTQAGATPSPAAEGSPTTDKQIDWLATIVGPAVVAALITVVIGGAITVLATRYKDRNSARLELRLKSLNEFYAPIRTLLGENKVLADALRAELGVTGDAKWHSLDHLDDIKSIPTALQIMREILKVNERIGKILEAKSGLDLAESVYASKWQVHRRMLARAFAEGAGDIKSELAYFPREFEDEIVRVHKAFLVEVNSSVGIRNL